MALSKQQFDELKSSVEVGEAFDEAKFSGVEDLEDVGGAAIKKPFLSKKFILPAAALSLFFATSCEKSDGSTDGEVIPIGQVDNTVEIKEATGTARQYYEVTPISVEVPFENSIRELYLDQSGEGYILGYDINTQIPSSFDLSKYSKYNLCIQVKQKDGTYKMMSETPLSNVDKTYNNDLNSDGKVQNNEKGLYLKGKTTLISSTLESEKDLFTYYTNSRREIMGIDGNPTGRTVPSIGVMKSLQSVGMLKLTLVGVKDDAQPTEIIALINLNQFTQ